MSDSYVDDVSRSQHKLAIRKQMAKHDMAPNSTAASDEEKAVEDDDEVEQSIDGQSSTCFESTMTAAFFSRFTEMSRQFAKMMDMHRKQQLVAKKKSASGAFTFDSPPPAKFRKLKSPFTQPRSAADNIGATQADDDFERDSLASQ